MSRHVTANQAAKAVRMLQTGRVTVLRVVPGVFEARVHGSSGIYTVTWSPDAGWACSCPASRFGWNECSHVIACEAVSSGRDLSEIAALVVTRAIMEAAA